MKVWKKCMMAALTLAASGWFAVAAATAPALDEATLKARASAFIGSPISDLSPAPIDGFFEASSDQGLFYISADGEHLMWGKLYKMTPPVADLTEESYRKLRVKAFAELKDDMIVFPAKNEKHVLTVFTDISCGYCRKLHKEMAEFNDMGFTIRYLAYPRGGKQSPVYKDMVSIWCSKDRKAAIDNAKAGGAVDKIDCPDVVAQQYDIGNRIGIRGTPAVYLEDGMQVGGFIEPADLMKIVTQRQTLPAAK